MITEQQLTEQTERVTAIGKQIEALAVVFHEENDKLKRMVQQWKFHTLVYGEEAKAIMNTQAPVAAQNAANQANSEASRMVHVDWSGRGHSSGKYKVLSETERYVTIEFHLERKMTVSKARVKDAA